MHLSVPPISAVHHYDQADQVQVFKGYDRDASKQSSTAIDSVSATAQLQPTQAAQHQLSMQPSSGPDPQPAAIPQPILGPPPKKPPPLTGGAGPPLHPVIPMLLGSSMPPHLMGQHFAQHMHSRPGMLGSQQDPMHVHMMHSQNGHIGHGFPGSHEALMHAHKRQRTDLSGFEPGMEGARPPASPPPGMQQPHGGPLPPPPHMQHQPSNPPQWPPHMQPPQHAHARPGGPPQLPPHDLPHNGHARPVGLPPPPPHPPHVKAQQLQSSNGHAAGYNGAPQQPGPGQPPLPPHIAESTAQQQHDQVPHEIFQQQSMRRPAGVGPPQHSKGPATRGPASHDDMQPGEDSAAHKLQNGQKHSKRSRAKQRQQQQQSEKPLDNEDASEQLDNGLWHQRDAASVPGLMNFSAWPPHKVALPILHQPH